MYTRPSRMTSLQGYATRQGGRSKGLRTIARADGERKINGPVRVYAPSLIILKTVFVLIPLFAAKLDIVISVIGFRDGGDGLAV